MTDRKKYSQEFKLDAVSLVVYQGCTRVEAARNWGVNHSMLGRWVKEHQQEDGQAFRGYGGIAPTQFFRWTSPYCCSAVSRTAVVDDSALRQDAECEKVSVPREFLTVRHSRVQLERNFGSYWDY